MKRAYLTIDDGPSVDRRQKVDILNRYGIQAVWFSMGCDMEKRPDDVIYSIRNGQIIGNHSYSHPNFSELDPNMFREEIQRTDEMIEEFYRIAGVKRPIKLFRFPFGNEGSTQGFYDFDYSTDEKERVESIQLILKELGYTTFSFENITYKYFDKMKETGHVDWLWTYDAMEWCVFQERPPYGVCTLDDVLEMMELDLPEKWMGLNYPASDEIIVIHDHPQTTEMFEPIICALIDRGIEFIRYFE